MDSFESSVEFGMEGQGRFDWPVEQRRFRREPSPTRRRSDPTDSISGARMNVIGTSPIDAKSAIALKLPSCRP
ncbi:MAG: hypothetical protein MZU97_05070 [Bacillus subtilis]|nr:hypothetical protein [Bacillus subtilis]